MWLIPSQFQILLHCTVCKNTTYRLMSPYLHTCAMGNKRFGLCFQSSYEACLFQKQFQKAIEHLYSQSKSSKKGQSVLECSSLTELTIVLRCFFFIVKILRNFVTLPDQLSLARSSLWERDRRELCPSALIL